jgi:hypothetical protein
MPDIPADLRHSEDHLWVHARPGTSLVRAGVTDFAPVTGTVRRVSGS